MNLVNPPSRLLLFSGDPHTCPYLPERLSVTTFIDPSFSLSTELYDLLLERGFRRSGNHVYRPHCPTCRACISVRVPVVDFKPNRNQRRIISRHQHTRVSMHKPGFNPNHYAMYKRYLAVRHEDSDMNAGDQNHYLDFLTSRWCDTVFYEFHDANDHCFAVSVVDRLPRGLSAVYTFFDPDHSHSSPGQYAILWLIAQAKRLNLRWLYLGYWIASCEKMRYKINYQPLEALIDAAWLRITK